MEDNIIPTKEESNPVPTTFNPIQNLKNRHVFTKEDRVKGGRARTQRKSAANSVKNLKTGNYSKRIDKCNTCPYKIQDVCVWFKPDQACKMQVEAIRDVAIMHAGGPEALFREFNKTLQHFKLKVLSNPDEKTMRDYMKLLLDYKSARYGDRYFSVSMDLSTYLAKVMEEYDKQHVNQSPKVIEVNP